MDSASDPKRIDRVNLACAQCRSRHVKCDATLPVCNRCHRDGKDCIYQKSKRGGLDKAALARRRLRLQQEAERAQQDQSPNDGGCQLSKPSSTRPPLGNSCLFDDVSQLPTMNAVRIIEPPLPQTESLAFQVSNDRLLELYFENFWPSFPVVLPLHYLQAWQQLNNNHGMNELLPVLYWIGSIYVPHTPSQPYYEIALSGLDSPTLAHTPFNVQALMLFAIAQYHYDIRLEAEERLNDAITMALALRMNEKGFAQVYGEANPVLEESWRRTFYMLSVVYQHFAIINNRPIYTLLTVPNLVDLPCDDKYFECGVSGTMRVCIWFPVYLHE